MNVPWDIRLFIFEGALFCIFIGIAWRNGYPSFNSAFGLKFKKAVEKEQNWKIFHQRAGMIWILLGLWFLIPFNNLLLVAAVQIPAAVLLSVFGILFIYRRFI